MPRTRKEKPVASPGTVSHCTLRTEDLIPAFTSHLKEIGVKHPFAGLHPICAIACATGDDHWYWNSDAAEFDLNNLFDRMDWYAPPRHYFGASEGDGADFGYWRCEMERITLDNFMTDRCRAIVERLTSEGETITDTDQIAAELDAICENPNDYGMEFCQLTIVRSKIPGGEPEMWGLDKRTVGTRHVTLYQITEGG